MKLVIMVLCLPVRRAPVRRTGAAVELLCFNASRAMRTEKGGQDVMMTAELGFSMGFNLKLGFKVCGLGFKDESGSVWKDLECSGSLWVDTSGMFQGDVELM